MDRRKFIAGSMALGSGAAGWRVAAAPRAYGSQALLRLGNNRPGVNVFINGQGPFVFLVDTATSHTVMVPRLRDRLGLTAVPGPVREVVTAAGAVASHFHHVREIAAAGVIVEGTQAVIIDLPREFGIDGILGADFLWHFTVDLDLRAQRMTLYPENTVVSPPGFHRIHGQVNTHGFIVVPAQVTRMPVSALLDTGAEQTVANQRIATFARNIGMSTILRTVESKVTDAADQKRWAESYDFASIKLGPATFFAARVMISEMRVFEHIGLTKQPALFFGMNLLQGRRIIIDYGNASIWLRG